MQSYRSNQLRLDLSRASFSTPQYPTNTVRSYDGLAVTNDWIVSGCGAVKTNNG